MVVLLDTSYSMGFGDRWERARKAARDAVASSGASDRGSIVLFASGTEISCDRPASARALAAVD